MTHLTDPGRTSILFVDPAAELYLPSLRTRFEVTAASTHEQAIRALRVFQPTLVITELELSGGDGVTVCREAKALPTAARVLVTTAAAERVPEALIAGCDAVLMKPFAPILLYMRIGRLLQQEWDSVRAGTNVVRDDQHCPACAKTNIVGFDVASRCGMWYACLECLHAWIGPSVEPSVNLRRPLPPVSEPAQQLGAG